MKHFSIVLTLFTAYLSACSANLSDEGPECGPNASCPPPNLLPAENILGLWDRSKVQSSGTDVSYTYIGRDGEFLSYDFQQDDFGTGENCHLLTPGRIWRNDAATNTYSFDTEDTDVLGVTGAAITLLRQERNLFVVQANGLEETWVRLDGVLREDLVLCERLEESG